MQPRSDWSRWSAVVVFALAMAWVEAAVVFYLRTLIDRIEPYQPHPLPVSAGLGTAELIREFATLVMLATVGYLAGRTWRSRVGYALLAFGFWDLGYYAFLVPLTGWPHSLMDWDILFLIPLPWWGPVLAPVLIASLMVVGGSLITLGHRGDAPTWPTRRSLAACFAGGLIALEVFMADALRVAPQGREAVRELLPTSFNWPAFLVAGSLMFTPVLSLLLQRMRARGPLDGHAGGSMPEGTNLAREPVPGIGATESEPK